MPGIRRQARLCRQTARLARLKPAVWHKDFDQVKVYCMFICHARSGHTLLGSLLDAHPEVIIAQELNVLALLENGLTREQLYHGICRRSRCFTLSGRKWNGYEYKVPNQWHGRYRQLTVIGDKMGSVSANALHRQPGMLQQLQKTVGVPVKFFRVIRNPFDNIPTLSRYYHRMELLPAVESYFSRCANIENIRQNVEPENWMDLYHEELIRAPEETLTAACRYLGLETSKEYLEDCASIVFKSPLKRRHEVQWPLNPLLPDPGKGKPTPKKAISYQ